MRNRGAKRQSEPLHGLFLLAWIAPLSSSLQYRCVLVRPSRLGVCPVRVLCHRDGLLFLSSLILTYFLIILYSMYSHLYSCVLHVYFTNSSCTPQIRKYTRSTVRVQPEYNVLYSAHERTLHFHRVHTRVHTRVHIEYIPILRAAMRGSGVERAL